MNWSTVSVSSIITIIVAAVPILLGSLLNRKNANKKLDLSETSVMISGTEAQIKTYQDLLNRAEAAVEKAEALNGGLNDRVKHLEKTIDSQDWQIRSLRNLFQKVVGRSNITLTKEEQDEFDRTMPTSEFRNLYKPSTP